MKLAALTEPSFIAAGEVRSVISGCVEASPCHDDACVWSVGTHPACRYPERRDPSALHHSANGETGGLAISTVMLCTAILVSSWLTIRWMAPATPRDAWMIGATWLALTLAFEFLAGHYLFGKPWRQLLADYNILRGRIWVLVLVTTAIAPWLMARTRGLLHGSG
jgi:hypothetical protein